MLNKLLELIGLAGWQQNWLGDPKTVVYAICVPLVWQYIGLYMIIFLSGFTSIPQDVLDVAEIDGATGFKRVVHIILPLMKSTINVALLLVISGGVKIFDQIYAMSAGGPGYSSMVLAMYAYSKAFGENRHGYGAAIAVEMLIISLVLIAVMTKILGGTKQHEY